LDDLECWGFAHQRLTSSRKFLGWSSARRLVLEKKQSLSSFSSDYLPNFVVKFVWSRTSFIDLSSETRILQNQPKSTKKVEIAIFNLEEMKEMPTMAHITLSDVTGNNIFLTDWIFKEYKIKI
jgi:hypothetical protein